MWSSLEKAAKKAAKQVDDAAKKVMENEKVQAMAEKADAETKKLTQKITANEQVKKVATKVKKGTDKVAKRFSGKKKTDGNEDDDDDGKIQMKIEFPNAIPMIKDERYGDGDGDENLSGCTDLSDITWSDGSIRRMPSVRVFGKDSILSRSGAAVDNRITRVEEGILESAELEDETPVAVPAPVPAPTTTKVNLPILIFPGLCSAGLYIKESGLDNDKYKGRRIWMDPGFLAVSAMNNTVIDTSREEESVNTERYVTDDNASYNSLYGNVEDLDKNYESTTSLIGKRDSNAITTPYVTPEDLNRNSMYGNVENVDSERSAGLYVNDANDVNDNKFVEDKENAEDDTETRIEFAKKEEEVQIKSSWLYHITLEKNMVDERPGNKVRPYEGISGCDYLTDMAATKEAAVVFGNTLRFLEGTMGYVRGKNLDAVPYDWRLAPSCCETRDGFLTNTIKRVEKMYEENGLPIVILCHSLGCKMGHYWLNFCLKEKGREWIDKHIHTYMPVGAPHGGANKALRLAVTGAGLVSFIDNVILSDDEGVIFYRSSGSTAWLMPRDLPKGMLPPAIVRREGELGIKITSEIDVGSLFADRQTKPPKELRLKIVYREKYQACTDFVPVKINEFTSPVSMSLSFDETFYLAVPYLEEEDDIGSLVFYLEEPSGRMDTHHSNSLRRNFQSATKWARGFKKEFTKMCRNVAKKIGGVYRVAVCQKPLQLKASAFKESSATAMDGVAVIKSVIPFCRCNGGIDAQRILELSTNNQEEEVAGAQRSLEPYIADPNSSLNPEQAVGTLAIHLKYTPPANFAEEPSCYNTKFSMMSENTPIPPVVSRKFKDNSINEKIVYDAWNGTNLVEKDGFWNDVFDFYEEYYEQDPIGPVTKSALDAPPVNIVRSIYGINLPTDVSAVYRKESVVVVGDSKADFRYKIDKSASFLRADERDAADKGQLVDQELEEMLKGYQLKDGVIYETPETLQKVPGETELRRCCGDQTVPYWSLVHCLTWKDTIPDVTVDELEGAIHRDILSDKRFHALLQEYCTIDDNRNTLAIATV